MKMALQTDKNIIIPVDNGVKNIDRSFKHASGKRFLNNQTHSK